MMKFKRRDLESALKNVFKATYATGIPFTYKEEVGKSSSNFSVDLIQNIICFHVLQYPIIAPLAPV